MSKSAIPGAKRHTTKRTIKRKAGTKAKPKAKTVAARKPRKIGKKPNTPAQQEASRINGQNGGRPPLYANVEDFDRMIAAYFTSCDNRIKCVGIDKDGEAKMALVPEPYTIGGLIVYLGFSDWDALKDHEARPGFAESCKKARIRIEADVERRLMDGNAPTGPIFWLKNNARDRYADRIENEHTGKNGGPIQQETTIRFVKTGE